MNDQLIDSLVAGFMDDPLYRWLYPDPRQRPGALRANVSLVLQLASDVGHIEVAPGQVGAAIWTGPGVQLLADPEPFVELLARWAPARAETALAAMQACSLHEPDAVGVLHMVAVQPSRRGHGLGSLLLRPWLDELEGMMVEGYLESSNPRNLTFYERAGFRVLGEVALGHGGPTMRPMIRDRRSPAGDRLRRGS